MHRGKKMSVLREDMARVFKSPKTYLALLAGLFLILRPLFDDIGTWENYSPMELLAIPLGISDFTPFAVVFCLLPFAESYCEDVNSGYYYHILIRTGTRKYAAQRCLSVGLSGGLVMGAIMAVTIGFCWMAGGESVPVEELSFLNNTMWARTGILRIWNGNLLYLLRVLVAFLFGFVWALVGLAISVLIPNKYVTLAAPFVIYEFMWFLLGELPINPAYMFRGDSGFIPSFGFLLAYQAAIISICSAISYYGMTRRARL